MKNMSKFKRNMYVIAIGSLVLMFVFFGLYKLTSSGIHMTFCITSMTICYHFTIRLVIGNITDMIMRCEADWRKPRFRERKFEEKLYKKLKVRQWKSRMPTFDESAFSFEKQPIERIIGATCQSETVHELNILASLAAIFFAIPFGSLWVFIITSVLGAAYDLIFVIIQRYNRPRLLRALQRRNR
ncbi:MAG: hypothetical protein NC299_04455 [Lachnospiraceae bacterium]|nr:hypothetical protein [Ruminococcus sp.]MCM1274600.1 hypothetical protein [Lachnospiraceae bacterium]